MASMFAIMLAGCKSECDKLAEDAKAAAMHSPTGDGMTLNGVSAVNAGKMMQQFLSRKDDDKNPVPMSFLINKDMIHNIATVLKQEYSADSIKKGGDTSDKLKDLTDGVRIYFASDPSVNESPLKNTILLVLTKDGGPVEQGVLHSKTGRKHKDNYTYSKDALLFHMRQYEIPVVGAKCPGCLLYDPQEPTAPLCNSPHSISRAQAHDMIIAFNGHEINTEAEWFDIDFWKTLDKLPKPFNGIRVYFARHNLYTTPERAHVSDRNAVIITTTKRQGGFDIDDFDCYKELAKYFANYKKMFTKGDPKDNGELCPDNCE